MKTSYVEKDELPINSTLLSTEAPPLEVSYIFMTFLQNSNHLQGVTFSTVHPWIRQWHGFVTKSLDEAILQPMVYGCDVGNTLIPNIVSCCCIFHTVW